jgi:hypothetical protein
MRGLKPALVIGCILLTLTLTVIGTSSAEIPKKITYQGRLTDGATGNPLAGTHEMAFGIYDDPDEGVLLWSESQPVPADSLGVFSAVLGSITPIEVTFDGPVWLEVQVGGEALWPRREIVSVPFAFAADRAADAWNSDSLGGYAADAFADSSHIHDDRYVPRDSLSTVGGLNDEWNPVDWSRLKGVPGGFADGVDDVGGSGDGHSLDAADGNPADAVYVDNGGNVGIGTTSPNSKLDVAGSLNLADALKMGGTRVLQADMINTFCGVDAGVSSTTGSSNTFVGASAGAQNTSGGTNTFVGRGAGAGNTTAWQNTFVGAHAGMGNVTGSNSVFVGMSAGVSNGAGHENTFVGCFAGIMNRDASDNTFVGARSGESNTSGYSNTYLGKEAGYVDSTGTGNTFVGKSAGMWTTSGSGNVFLGHEAGYDEMGSNKLYIANGRDAEDVLIYGDFADGRIGLGTLAPERQLHIKGVNPRILIEASSLSHEVKFKSSGDGAGEVWALYKDSGTDDLRFYQAGDRVVIESATGRLGVGTTNPTGQVHAEATDIAGLLGRSQNNDGVIGWTGASGKSGVYGWSSTGAGVSGRSEAASGRGVDGAATGTGGVGVYGRSSNGIGMVAESDNSHAIQIANAGQDGIRLLNGIGRDYIRAGSDADLHFRVTNTGEAYADGGWKGAADFAELMSVEGGVETCEPGDVLVISTAVDRHVERSSEPRSTLVTGVYSAKPGFVGSPHVMEGRGDDEIPVAVVGIVPCKASAENGPIGRGDLLVTSSTPGHAMRAGTAEPGTIIGKALEPLPSGTGVIEILVTLH